MGRPVNPRFLGDPDQAGFQITGTVLVDVGEGVEGGVILRQRSNNRYLVEGKESDEKRVCKLVSGVPQTVGEMSVEVLSGLVSTIQGQDQTDFTGSDDQGTFADGTDYDASDTITLSDGTVVTVNAVDAGGEVTEFTVTTAGSAIESGSTLTQDSTSGSGTGFELVLGADNEESEVIGYARNINNRTVKTFDGDVLSWPKGTEVTRRTKVNVQGR